MTPTRSAQTKPVKIVLETHSTSIDNERGLASGHADSPLSPRGERQAAEMGARYQSALPGVVFCSDLQRSYRTAEIAFSAWADLKIVRDARLRECDYGSWTQRPRREVNKVRAKFVREPFPGGESLWDALVRVREFLRDLWDSDDRSGFVLLIGHRATHYGLDYWINGKSENELLHSRWSWQPGWSFELRARP